MADDPTSDDPNSDDTTDTKDLAPGELDPVEEDGEDLGEVAGGGEITDLGGDSPSS